MVQGNVIKDRIKKNYLVIDEQNSQDRQLSLNKYMKTYESKH